LFQSLLFFIATNFAQAGTGTGLVLETNKKGRQRGSTPFVIDEGDTTVVRIGLDGEGNVVTGGSVFSQDLDQHFLFLRKMAP
jgi:hypothetical protein